MLKHFIVTAALTAIAELSWSPVAFADEGGATSVIEAGGYSSAVCPFTDISLEDAAWALAVTAAAEARSDGELGMALTIEVMVSRLCANKRHYGGDNAGSIVTYPWAFSVYNDDSPVRSKLLDLLKKPTSGEGEIADWARRAYPFALAALQGWRTGMLPNDQHGCRHYLTRQATASWEKQTPDLVYRNHEFHCGVDG